jgi:hypothetical protein
MMAGMGPPVLLLQNIVHNYTASGTVLVLFECNRVERADDLLFQSVRLSGRSKPH